MADKGASSPGGQTAGPKVKEAAILLETRETSGRADNWPQEEKSVSAASKKSHSAHRSALTRVLCGLYAMLMVVMGVVLAVATTLTHTHHHLYYLEVFQLYLYTVSVAVLLYMHCCLLTGQQARSAQLDSSIRIVIQRGDHTLSLSPSSASRPPSLLLGTHSHRPQAGLEPRKTRPLSQTSRLSSASYFRSQLLLPPAGQVTHAGEGINFYLRLGALAFSLGSVTMDGFRVASYLESRDTDRCRSVLFIPVCLAHLLFTFCCTFFLFKNHKLVVGRAKGAVRAFLVHLLAANLCVACVSIITETTEDYYYHIFSASLSGLSCYVDRTLARRASPYLFPCTVVYSIIAATILFRLYSHMGVKVKGVGSMDCEKANKGLFCGLLVVVVSLVALATFLLLDSRLNNPQAGVKVLLILELSLLLWTGGGILAGYGKLQQLRFLHCPEQDSFLLSLDALLLLLALAGSYLYLAFRLMSSMSCLGGASSTRGLTVVLNVSAILVGLLQSTLQAIFICDGLCRRADNDAQVEKKPGRSLVTLVLLCNLALWLITLFEFRKIMVLPDALNFYGFLPWNILLHLLLPFHVYFRFHSAICLSTIWYRAYTKGE